jgi:predicted ribosomally synthesized peptide with SipW-like signal peptide
MTPTEPSYIVVPQAPTTPPKRRIPRIALLAVFALLLAGAGAGTFASFSASTSNTATFATGSLVLSNKVAAGTTCYSTGVATNTDVNDQACDAFFNNTAAKPGDSATVNLTLKNEGSLNATTLAAWVSTSCVSAVNPVATYTGSGNLCTQLQLTIQEYSDANRTVVSACRYGNAAVTNTCDFVDPTKTISNFQTLYPNSGQSLGLSTFASQASRYFTIGVKIPTSADNTMQGRLANFAIKWSLT